MALKILDGVDVILLDIEGTTTPIDFVHKALFHYAKDHIHEFLEENWNSEPVKKALAGIKAIYQASLVDRYDNLAELSAEELIDKFSSIIKDMIDADSKDESLKIIEGLIWEEGYSKGTLKGEVYPDVPQSMKKWKDSGKSISIYSSGSVLAQKMLFGTTYSGDLTLYIDGYFDTGTGKKTEPGSYLRISSILMKDAGRITFISDSTRELDAASSVGFKTVLVDRTKTIQSADYPIIHDFTEIA